MIGRRNISITCLLETNCRAQPTCQAARIMGRYKAQVRPGIAKRTELRFTGPDYFHNIRRSFPSAWDARRRHRLLSAGGQGIESATSSLSWTHIGKSVFVLDDGDTMFPYFPELALMVDVHDARQHKP